MEDAILLQSNPVTNILLLQLKRWNLWTYYFILSRLQQHFLMNHRSVFVARTPSSTVRGCKSELMFRLGICHFFRFSYMESISMINHDFLAPRLLEPLKSNPGDQNIPRVLLRDHSDHRGPLSDPIYLKKWWLDHSNKMNKWNQ